MLQVLIVDDESIFRLGIRSSVSWEEMDCTVCGEASNGEEALQMIYEKKPDIVFLDIKMPVMDGITLLRRIQGKFNHIYFVILSCFNEYDYVREAMKLGAYDYLFKPTMGVKELTNVLQEIRTKKYKECGSENDKEKQQYAEILAILKKGTTEDINENDRKKLKLLDEKTGGLPYIAVSIMLMKENIVVKLNSPAIETCKAIISQNIQCEKLYFIPLEDKNELCIICFSEEIPHTSYRKLKENWNKINICIKEYVEADASIGIGRVGKTLSVYNQCVREASIARTETFFTGESVSFYRPEFHQVYNFEKIYEKISVRIQDALIKKDMGTVYDLIRILKNDVIAHRYYSVDDYCHFLAVNMVAFMRKFRSGEILEQLLLEDYNLISNIYHQNKIEKANEEFFRVLKVCFQEVHGVSVNNMQEAIVTQAIRYIQEHYMDKISLNMIADQLHVNKNYFCKIFKQVTGMNMINYLTELRLEKATDMLENTDKKVYEIALEVGFQSYPHFCKTYKKYRNVSPTEIRRKMFIS